MSRYYEGIRWTGEICDCSLPIAMDTYNICSYKCAYCFSQFQRMGCRAGHESTYKKNLLEHISIDKIKKIFSLQTKSQFNRWIKEKRPIQWGALSDQFDENERQNGITLELLRFFSELDYPISFSSKAAWFTEDPRYMEIIQKMGKKWNFKISIITLDAEKAKKIERGVPSPVERLKAIERLSKTGASVTLRLRPFILGVSDETYIELIEQAHNYGAQALSTEFLCIETRATGFQYSRDNYEVLSSCCGLDILDFYRKYSKGTGYLRLNREIKRPYIKRMKKLCKKIGMRFYCSDASFKELSHNCCCCGLPDDWKFSRGSFSQALQIAKKEGEVHFSSIKDDLASYTAGYKWNNATNYNTNSAKKRTKFYDFTMYDYIHYLWNNPGLSNSPSNAFGGILLPVGTDKNGDIVYRYNRKESC